jgi:ligand-binding sensor domain-containing protein/signal transduction histidine kinase
MIRLPVVEGSDIRFVRLKRSLGLSQQRVSSILQDDKGFLWFGTVFGLNRYDGYHFRVFKTDPGNPDSLCDVAISSLFKDRAGSLWVGCNYGLDRYDPLTETFVHYRLPATSGHLGGWFEGNVHHISEDRTGLLWLSTLDGLYGLDPATGTIVHFRHDSADPFSLGSDDVRSSGEDRSGTFWVATRNGLDAFDPAKGRVTEHVPLPEERDFSFFEDRTGVFWILYASGNGLAVLDRKTMHLTRYSFGRDDLPTHPLTGVSSMVEDQNGALWIGTFSDGLLRFDRAQKRFIRYRNEPSDGMSLPEDRITTLFEDREGNLWIGLGTTEPAFFSTRRLPFEVLPFDSGNPDNLGEKMVNAVYEDGAGIIWMGTTGALVRFDRRAGRYTHMTVPGNGIASDVLSIVEDRSGALWIGTSGQGLYRRSPGSDRLTAFRHRDTDATSLSNDTVLRLLVDHGGTLWAGTLDGLDRFNPATQTFTVFREVEGSSGNNYGDLVEDSRHTLWAGTYSGLARFDPQSGRFTSHRDPRRSVRIGSLFIDHTGAIWSGTMSGLDGYDPSGNLVAHYAEKDGLPSDAVNCVLGDAAGGLWMGTSEGVSQFDPLRRTFRNYTEADGLPGRDFSGWRACFRNGRGEMFIGGFTGAVAFQPERLAERSYTPEVALTSFQLFGKPVGLGQGSPLHRAIDYTDQMTLAHDQNSFSFEFAALSLGSPSTNRYRYMLEGLDRAWHEVGSDRPYASYTTLPAGKYRFRVQGATIRGFWGEPGALVHITITPAWWATWWARALFAVAALLTILALYFLRVRQLHQRFESQLEARESERTRVARELHDTLLQTLQGLVLRFQVVYELLPGRPAEAKRDMQIAIDRTVRAIEEGRGAVQGLRATSVEGDDLAVAIKTLAGQLMRDHSGDDLVIRLEVQGTPRPLHPVVRDEIYRIGGEAMRNCLRHAQASHVEVELRYDVKRLRLRVRDDGAGIDPKSLSNDGAAGHFGLHGMRERAELIGGKLVIWTAAASGTEIELTVPANRAYVAATPRRFAWRASRVLAKSTDPAA